MSRPERSSTARGLTRRASPEALLSHLAHEARTPLAVAHGYAELLGRRGGERVVQEAARALPSCVARLSTTVDELVAALALEGGLLTLELDPLPLETLVVDAVAAEEAACENHRIVVSRSGAQARVLADREHALLAAKLVLRAGCKLFHEGGDLLVDIASRRGLGEVSVSSRRAGAGGAATRLFGDGDRTLAAELDVARRLVELHGGRVRVRLGGASGAARISLELPGADARGG